MEPIMKPPSRITWKRRFNHKPIGKGGRPLAVADWNTGHTSTILSVMDDGLFRTTRQIQNKSGIAHGSATGTINRVWTMGGLERAKNPKVDHRLPVGLRDGCIWLYRITDAGRARKPVRPNPRPPRMSFVRQSAVSKGLL